MKKKNPAAVALGSLGGKKSASNMTPAQRKARAKKAVKAREAKKAALNKYKISAIDFEYRRRGLYVDSNSQIKEWSEEDIES